MANNQLSLFNGTKQTVDEAINLTIEKLNYHIKSNHHIVISYSGGKDSTAVVTLFCDLLQKGLIPKPKSVTVVYADTRLELPPLQSSAYQIMKQAKNYGVKNKIAVAPIDKRFLVYILGRGVPPPNNSTLRWCTQKIKVAPMMEAIEDIRNQLNPDERILMLTGVRVGESAIRDNRIIMSCSKNGAECGQGWFQHETGKSTDTLAPIDHWRVCNVWDWLMFYASSLGFNTSLLAEVYGGDEATEINARTGCIGCPLAKEDTALNNLIRRPGWEYLTPLTELKIIFQEMRQFNHRLQKTELTVLKNGKLGANPNRKGPLLLESRLYFLDKILNIQNRINRNNPPVKIDLLNSLEVARIKKLIQLNTWPNGWDGTEEKGDVLTGQYNSNGDYQPLIWE